MAWYARGVPSAAAVKAGAVEEAGAVAGEGAGGVAEGSGMAGPDGAGPGAEAAPGAAAGDRSTAAGAVAARPDAGDACKPPLVLQVLPALATGGGGVERATLDIAAALTAAGRPGIVASSGGALAREVERRGARHITLPLASKNPLTVLGNVAPLRRVIAEYGVEVVHARSRAPAWSALLAARREGVPFVATFHGTYNFAPGPLGALKRRYNAVMTAGDRVIANSRFIAAHIGENYKVAADRIRVVARGIDTDSFDAGRLSTARVVALATAWRLQDGVPVIVLPGRLTRWKGQALLVEALARLAARPDTAGRAEPGAPAFQCLLVGADQGRDAYRAEIERAIEAAGLAGRVRLTGHCDDMPAAYRLADVVVSASTDPEAFGRVVAEAQAMGRPVVVAGHGGAAEQVIDGVTGFHFAPRDPEALAEALARALSLGADDRARLAANAAAHVRRHYTTARMCAETLAVYREVAAARDRDV
ncbi:MAG: glycosyltransferase family 4 protein [Alphaproteobacteria bacterium]